MDDSQEREQSPAEVKAGLDALKAMQATATPQKNDAEAIDERRQRARASQKEFIIRLYVTGLGVVALLSVSIYLMIRLT